MWPSRGSSRAFRPRIVATMSPAGLAFLQERRNDTKLLYTPDGKKVAQDASGGTFAKALCPYWLAQDGGWCVDES